MIKWENKGLEQNTVLPLKRLPNSEDVWGRRIKNLPGNLKGQFGALVLVDYFRVDGTKTHWSHLEVLEVQATGTEARRIN